jgi:hypothetical protein
LCRKGIPTKPEDGFFCCDKHLFEAQARCQADGGVIVGSMEARIKTFSENAFFNGFLSVTQT